MMDDMLKNERDELIEAVSNAKERIGELDKIILMSTTVKLSLREAAKAFDVSRPTLQKAIKSGKISAEQNSEGHWQVDPSELARVYNPRTSEHGKEQNALPTISTPEQAEIERLKAELAEAQKAQAVAEELAAERLERLADIKGAIK